MSAASTKVTSTPAPSVPKTTTVHPIPLLDHPIATAASLAHPLLLGSLFAWSFDGLVAKPARALQLALPIVVVIQVVYAITCLPVAGSHNGKSSKKKKTDGSSPNPVVTSVLALLLTAIVTPALHILFVLFGAPFLTHISHTFLCCAHLAVLAVFPIFYVRGVDTQPLAAVMGASAPLDETFGGLVGACVGAWLGAVPIPLDWDREWQKWPVTIIVGLYIGYMLGAKVLGKALYSKQWVSPEDTVKEE